MGLVLLVAVFPTTAHALTVVYLALQGDGTASVSLDGKVAYLADGGRAGERGIKSALVQGVPVAKYLEDNGVKTVIVSCSHPHADHMDGLKDLIAQGALSKFELHFVDAFTPGEYSKTLAALHEKVTGKSANYVNAIGVNAFKNLPKGESLTASNYVYDAATVGGTDHDSAMIMQYDFGAGKDRQRVVDFDDASTRLVEHWAAHNEVVHTLVVPHHGSSNNKLTAILDKKEKFGLKRVIFTANRFNRYGHPEPKVLLEFIQKLGPESVFITDSEIGRNVAIGSDGTVMVTDPQEARDRLSEYLASREKVYEARLMNLVDLAAQDSPGVLSMKFNAATAQQDLAEHLKGSKALSEKQRSAAIKTTEALQALREARAIVDRVPAHPNPLAHMLTAGLHSRALQDAENRKKKPAVVAPAAPMEGGGFPEPPPERPTPRDGSPLGGGGPSGRGDGSAEFSRETMGSIHDMEQRHPSVGEGSSPAARRSAMFRTTLASPRIRFGGVVIGNSATGPVPETLEFLVLRDADLFEATPTVPAQRGDEVIVLRIGFQNGEYADYAEFSEQELWAALNFVQPGEMVRNRLSEHGLPELPQGTQVGLVGLTGKSLWAEYFPNSASWEFAVNPAIVHSRIALDAMRLDMALSVARQLDREGISLPAMQNVDLKSLNHSTYQWHDRPAFIHVANRRIMVRPFREAGSCLMSVRLIRDHDDNPPRYPSWFDAEASHESVRREAARLANGPWGSERFIAQLWDEIDRIERQALEFNMPHASLESMCKNFDALVRIDRFARLVAVLHWYKDTTGKELPMPAFLANYTDRHFLEPTVLRRTVFPHPLPTVAWRAFASFAVVYALAVWLLTSMAGIVMLLDAGLQRWRRGNADPN